MGLYSQSSSQRQTPPQSLLLIDDDPGDLELLSRLARDAFQDTEIQTVTNTSALHDCLQNQQPELVLIDQFIGAELGTDLIRELRQAFHGIKFVLVTGSGDEGIAIGALRAGASDYLNKQSLSADCLLDLAQRLWQQEDTKPQATVDVWY